MKIIDEQRLLDYTRCPLRAGPGVQEPVIERVAESLVQQLSLLAYEGSLPRLSHVRERAEALFKAAGEPVADHSRQLIRLCRRAHDLFTFNAVLHPETLYHLDIGTVVVEGSLTVLRAANRTEARVLRLRPRGAASPFAPDVVSMSRWLYGFKESGYPSCAVYNYGILYDLALRETFSEAQVQRWLIAATTSYTQRRAFPVPGTHCKGCARPCEEAKPCSPTS
jgi:hypothetical protein